LQEAEKKVIFINIKELGETHAGFHKEISEAVFGRSRSEKGWT
jgi:hypothetical protein